MKKTLIASAVAMATFSSMTLAAEATMPTFYGNLQLVHSNEDYDSDRNQRNVHEFKDTGSTLGLKHSHELDSGIEAFMKAELEFNGDSKEESDGELNLDEAYVGFKGGFGSIQFGSDETVYDWIDVVDLSDEFGLGGGIAVQEEGDNFQYVLEAGEGFMIGATLPTESDSNFGGALAGKFSAEAFSVALSYAMGRKEGGVEAGDTIGLGASFNLDALVLNAQYETLDDSTSAANDGKDYLALQGVYTMGANAFRLGYGMTSEDTVDTNDIELALVHTMSSNLYLYVESVFRTEDPDVGSKLSDTMYAFGATYSF